MDPSVQKKIFREMKIRVPKSLKPLFSNVNGLSWEHAWRSMDRLNRSKAVYGFQFPEMQQYSKLMLLKNHKDFKAPWATFDPTIQQEWLLAQMVPYGVMMGEFWYVVAKPLVY